jgi:leader peptidase (prepilin peptidase) / N-methyltransferase
MMAAVLAVGALGALIGSFLNVVVYRVPRGLSVARPRSACGACGHEIRWYDNIPLVSWIALRGRCRDCDAPIAVRYPLVELGTAVLLAVVGIRFLPAVFGSTTVPSGIASGLELVAYLYLAAISVALGVIDLETRRLPNAIVLPAYLVGLALLGGATALGGDVVPLLTALATAGAFVVLYAIPAFARPGAMGMGDVKLAGVLGLFLGWVGVPSALVGLLGGFVLGGIAGLALLLAGRGRSAQLAFGPWLLAGAWIGILLGEPIAAGYLGLFGLR